MSISKWKRNKKSIPDFGVCVATSLSLSLATAAAQSSSRIIMEEAVRGGGGGEGHGKHPSSNFGTLPTVPTIPFEVLRALIAETPLPATYPVSSALSKSSSDTVVEEALVPPLFAEYLKAMQSERDALVASNAKLIEGMNSAGGVIGGISSATRATVLQCMTQFANLVYDVCHFEANSSTSNPLHPHPHQPFGHSPPFPSYGVPSSASSVAELCRARIISTLFALTGGSGSLGGGGGFMQPPHPPQMLPPLARYCLYTVWLSVKLQQTAVALKSLSTASSDPNSHGGFDAETVQSTLVAFATPFLCFEEGGSTQSQGVDQQVRPAAAASRGGKGTSYYNHSEVRAGAQHSNILYEEHNSIIPKRLPRLILTPHSAIEMSPFPENVADEGLMAMHLVAATLVRDAGRTLSALTDAETLFTHALDGILSLDRPRNAMEILFLRPSVGRDGVESFSMSTRMASTSPVTEGDRVLHFGASPQSRRTTVSCLSVALPRKFSDMYNMIASSSSTLSERSSFSSSSASASVLLACGQLSEIDPARVPVVIAAKEAYKSYSLAEEILTASAELESALNESKHGIWYVGSDASASSVSPRQVSSTKSSSASTHSSSSGRNTSSIDGRPFYAFARSALVAAVGAAVSKYTFLSYTTAVSGCVGAYSLIASQGSEGLKGKTAPQSSPLPGSGLVVLYREELLAKYCLTTARELLERLGSYYSASNTGAQQRGIETRSLTLWRANTDDKALLCVPNILLACGLVHSAMYHYHKEDRMPLSLMPTILPAIMMADTILGATMKELGLGDDEERAKAEVDDDDDTANPFELMARKTAAGATSSVSFAKGTSAGRLFFSLTFLVALVKDVKRLKKNFLQENETVYVDVVPQKVLSSLEAVAHVGLTTLSSSNDSISTSSSSKPKGGAGLLASVFTSTITSIFGGGSKKQEELPTTPTSPLIDKERHNHPSNARLLALGDVCIREIVAGFFAPAAYLRWSTRSEGGHTTRSHTAAAMAAATEGSPSDCDAMLLGSSLSSLPTPYLVVGGEATSSQPNQIASSSTRLHEIVNFIRSCQTADTFCESVERSLALGSSASGAGEHYQLNTAASIFSASSSSAPSLRMASLQTQFAFILPRDMALMAYNTYRDCLMRCLHLSNTSIERWRAAEAEAARQRCVEEERAAQQKKRAMAALAAAQTALVSSEANARDELVQQAFRARTVIEELQMTACIEARYRAMERETREREQRRAQATERARREAALFATLEERWGSLVAFHRDVEEVARREKQTLWAVTEQRCHSAWASRVQTASRAQKERENDLDQRRAAVLAADVARLEEERRRAEEEVARLKAKARLVEEEERAKVVALRQKRQREEDAISRRREQEEEEARALAARRLRLVQEEEEALRKSRQAAAVPPPSPPIMPTAVTPSQGIEAENGGGAGAKFSSKLAAKMKSAGKRVREEGEAAPAVQPAPHDVTSSTYASMPAMPNKKNEECEPPHFKASRAEEASHHNPQQKQAEEQKERGLGFSFYSKEDDEKASEQHSEGSSKKKGFSF